MKSRNAYRQGWCESGMRRVLLSFGQWEGGSVCVRQENIGRMETYGLLLLRPIYREEKLDAARRELSFACRPCRASLCLRLVARSCPARPPSRVLLPHSAA